MKLKEQIAKTELKLMLDCRQVLQKNDTVITSYSIHYTKLYDT